MFKVPNTEGVMETISFWAWLTSTAQQRHEWKARREVAQKAKRDFWVARATAWNEAKHGPDAKR